MSKTLAPVVNEMWFQSGIPNELMERRFQKEICANYLLNKASKWLIIIYVSNLKPIVEADHTKQIRKYEDFNCNRDDTSNSPNLYCKWQIYAMVRNSYLVYVSFIDIIYC